MLQCVIGFGLWDVQNNRGSKRTEMKPKSMCLFCGCCCWSWFSSSSYAAQKGRQREIEQSGGVPRWGVHTPVAWLHIIIYTYSIRYSIENVYSICVAFLALCSPFKFQLCCGFDVLFWFCCCCCCCCWVAVCVFAFGIELQIVAKFCI